MVLIRHLPIHTLSILLVSLCLNACSHLGSQSQQNRSPNKPIIPAESQRVLFPKKQTTPIIKSENSVSQEQALPTNGPEIISTETPVLPKGKSLKPADVLVSIIDSTKKAISNQQWLRAQHHLENALRIAPKDAQVFYLYSEVYEGLGVPEQAINMLKRALFLAKPDSHIYNLANAKLEQLSE